MEFVFFETELAKLTYFSSQKILYIGLKSNADYSLENVKESFKKIHEVKKEERIFVLVDITKLAYEHIPKEAMAFLADNQYIQYQIKLAIVVKNLAHKILGSSFLKVFKPKTETRVFKTLPDAINWFGFEEKVIKDLENALQHNS